MRNRLMTPISAIFSTLAAGAVLWTVGGCGSTTTTDPACATVTSTHDHLDAVLHEPPPEASKDLHSDAFALRALVQEASNTNVKDALPPVADDLDLASKAQVPPNLSQDWQTLLHACGS